MLPPLNLLSWEFWVEALGFWARDSDSLYRLALIVAGLIGIPLLISRTRSATRAARAALEQAKTAVERHKEQTSADRARRITESFPKAIEQLGGDKLETRLGAIYTLERIARDSEREYWSIMETLTAYVREHAPWPPRLTLANPFVELQGSSAGAEPVSIQVRPATDIQAILTVLGRRDKKARKQDEAAERRLDLTAIDLRGAHSRGACFEGADLEGADLEGAHLEGAHLKGARLEGADLRGAHLEGAHLWRAHLEGADLTEARLEGANLWRQRLQGAHLWRAHLEDADLTEAHLEGANLTGAHLESANLAGAIGLTQEQLNMASGDDRTVVPQGLTRPPRWSPATPAATPG